jgi:large repetitive protein
MQDGRLLLRVSRIIGLFLLLLFAGVACSSNNSGSSSSSNGTTPPASFTVTLTTGNSNNDATATAVGPETFPSPTSQATPPPTSQPTPSPTIETFPGPTPTPTPWPLPIITSISPSSGPSAGGTTVIITGINFTSATGVSFGQTVVSKFTVDSDTQITVVSPNGTGTVDVTVSNPGNISPTNSTDQFSFI